DRSPRTRRMLLLAHLDWNFRKSRLLHRIYALSLLSIIGGCALQISQTAEVETVAVGEFRLSVRSFNICFYECMGVCVFRWTERLGGTLEPAHRGGRRAELPFVFSAKCENFGAGLIQRCPVTEF